MSDFRPIVYSLCAGFSEKDIEAVLNGSKSAIIIDGLYSLDESINVSKAFNDRLKLFRGYRAINLDARFFGCPLNWDGHTLEEYFREAVRYRKLVEEVFDSLKLQHPVERVVDYLSLGWSAGARIAVNEMGETFFAGDIRIIDSAPIHNDFIRRRNDLPSLSEITEQLSWNVYFSSPEIVGGQLEIFKKRWSERDINYKRLDVEEMGYSNEVVAGVKSQLIDPLPGRLVIFRSTNFHRVLKTTSPDKRFSCTSFIGYKCPTSPLLLWS